MNRSNNRRWPVRLILVGIVFVLVLPGLVFCGVLLSEFAQARRDEGRAQALAMAVRTADALDRELSNLTVALQVLATSTSLRIGDLAAFDVEARAAASALGQDIVLLDPANQPLVNTEAPVDGTMPTINPPGLLERVLATRAPAVSDLFNNTLTGEKLLSIMMPVIIRGDQPSYVIALDLDPSYLSRVLRRQELPPNWIVSVLDGHWRLLARNEDPEVFLGHPAQLDAQRHGTDQAAVWTGVSASGTPVVAAEAKLHLADWRAGIGVPISLVDAPVRRSVALLAGGGASVLAIGCLLAWLLARSISAPLQRLVLAGYRVGAGGAAEPVRSRIAEVEAVSRALSQATTELRSRNDALAAERAQLVAILETAPVGLLIADAASGRIIAGNGQLARMLRRPSQLDPDDDQALFDAEGNRIAPEQDPLVRALGGDERAELQCRCRRSDGSLFWVLAVGAAIRGADGAVTSAIVALLDIDETVRAREEKARWAERLEHEVAVRTAELESANQQLRNEIEARSRAEEQLRQAQKMDAVGRLTGGIAHDFNNMLTVIVGSLDLLRRRAPDLRSAQLLENALDGAHRAAALTARLLAFSRQQKLTPQAVDVNALVSGLSDLIRRTIGETIAVETVLAEGLWPAQTDPNQLENALLNLAVNARDAILEASPAGGRLTIETGNVTLDAAYAARHAEVLPGDYAMVAATDSGAGMSPPVLARAFEPFFTTKPVGQGTGLGLSQVHAFVRSCGGHVEIYSERGRGTIVKLYLPRVRVENPVIALASTSPGRADEGARGETVLVVEDEDGVRQLTADALQELGYTVLAANGAAEALGLLEAHPETALLLTDVVMAGVGGRELAAEARRRRPDLPVLFTTGYTSATVVGSGQLDPDADLLGKPFTVADLGAKLREVLARSRVVVPVAG